MNRPRNIAKMYKKHRPELDMNRLVNRVRHTYNVDASTARQIVAKLLEAHQAREGVPSTA